jgi:predicted alpha/beta superfamily hydrolase
MRGFVIATAASVMWYGPAWSQTRVSLSLSPIELHTLESTRVNDKYVIQLCLPPTYASSDRRFPVLYILDADRSFGLVCDAIGWLTRFNEILPAIVVGISYGTSDQDWWQKRSRDYTPSPDASKLWGEWPMAGGADAFRAFLRDELVPFVDGQYRTTPGDRGLVGLSFGGLFGAWVMLVDPTLFTRYVLVAPALAWDNRRVFGMEEAYARDHRQLPARVFIGNGALDEPIILESWSAYETQLLARKYDGLSMQVVQFPDETHISVFPAALTRGLRYILARQAGR